MVTVVTKDVGEVKDCFKKECEVSNTYEQEQDYIKKELRIRE